jgi:hypothetical protein
VNIYIESNFLLELILLQEEAEACEVILRLCEAGDCQLIIPSFAFFENQDTLHRKAREREELTTRLQYEVRQIQRSSGQPVDPYLRFADVLTSISVQASQRMRATHERVTKVAQMIPLNREVLDEFNRRALVVNLPFGDRIMYASILADLQMRSDPPHCFIFRDRDFSSGTLNPTIKNELTQYQCRLITPFTAGLNYIQSVLSTP